MKKHLDEILKFQKERDWKQYHSPKNLAISLSLETAEILELFQWTNNNALPEDKKMALSHELADVYSYILLLAHETGIDLDEAFTQKMEINLQNYPISKSQGNSKKYTDFD